MSWTVLASKSVLMVMVPLTTSALSALHLVQPVLIPQLPALHVTARVEQHGSLLTNATKIVQMERRLTVSLTPVQGVSLAVTSVHPRTKLTAFSVLTPSWSLMVSVSLPALRGTQRVTMGNHA
jgi:hypothetical protein